MPAVGRNVGSKGRRGGYRLLAVLPSLLYLPRSISFSSAAPACCYKFDWRVLT